MSTNSTHEWTVRKILEWTTDHLRKRGSDTPRLDAEVLLAHARGCERIQLYTNFDELLTDQQRGEMRDLVKRRAEHEPVAYLVGHREFYSMDFLVGPDVLIPRPDTETLVMEALEWLKGREGTSVLDLCTGSGCIALAIAKNAPESTVTATDVSEAALEIARANASTHELATRASFLQGDLFNAVSGHEPFDLIVSNPPYIQTAEMADLSPDIQKHEPHLALEAGSEGMQFLNRIIDAAGPHLKPGGCLMLEHSDRQTAAIRERLNQTGQFANVRLVRDVAGRDRVTIADRT